MGKNKQDVLVRAYATLSSLRKNIEQMGAVVEEKYVHEFHIALDSLEGIGIDVSEFRISDSELKHRDTAASQYVNGERISPYKPSEEKYVDKSFILTKLDAILGYFAIITSEKPRRIGFHTPDKP
ncbi:hypothetical protein ES703_100680 [subsurface metagenome]